MWTIGRSVILYWPWPSVNATRVNGGSTPALTRTAAREWAPKQVCCNVICPGAQSAAYQRTVEANPQMAATMASANPMGRIGLDFYRKDPKVVFAIIDCEKIGLGQVPDWVSTIGGRFGLPAGAPTVLIERRSWSQTGRLEEVSRTWLDPAQARYAARWR